MKVIMFLSLLNSTIFMNTMNPMIMVVLILTQTLMICLIMWASMQSSWFSYILFLVFMGGLMVLFIYMCSMAPNEKMKTFMNLKKIFFTFLLVIILMLLIKKNNSTIFMETAVFIKKMMFLNSITPVVTSMMYLLLTLVVVVKISNKKMGPLRSYKY